MTAAEATATLKKAPPTTHKRDVLCEIERRAQARWELEKPHERNYVPDKPKFLATFPYPYMNGRLHLGHSFTLSKVEFAVGYERLRGKNALFPFGFHCTGMPIKACADKLKREVALFGVNFENYKEDIEQNEDDAVAESSTTKAPLLDPSKQKKHGKAAAKATGLKYQFQIMTSMGVPVEEIHKFADSTYWLYYFPPKAIDDLKALGAHVDWRRSFITTDINPYYDSFIRWQFNKLRTIEPSPRIQFGERYTVFSAVDGQACMDHDRSVGEGVAAQEYTGIKLKVLLTDIERTNEADRPLIKSVPLGQKLTSVEFKKALGQRSLFLVAATLRPETMYGQTNCFVGVDITYGVYAVNDTEAWVCTERAAKNMSWQNLFAYPKGTLVKLADISGWDLVGAPLKAPLSSFESVYTLPMEGVLVNKGTGIVTSVPSDSPDDYITLMDLVKKAAYYNIQKEWVEPFLPPKPIISTPNYGNLAAVKAIEIFKIRSQKDKVLLALAKDAVYKEGFYHGTLCIGEYSGSTVQEAKPLIRSLLISQNLAFAYCEPDGLVISRSGDECVVTLADQWYMDFGEAEWKAKALECLAQCETFGPETRNSFEKTLDWLGQWACSRRFGLGSRLPWDPQWLIESLSDSTIYMAYYTVAHLLQGGSLDGSVVGPLGIKASKLTDEVWEYIMNDTAPLPSKSLIEPEKLLQLRQEFQYFYPLDLRCSGKDLVSNHLTFFIYNHVAMFKPDKWPKAIRANGHLLLNNEKMSKSTGNFLSLRQAIDKYGADAVRFALADAGDGLDDANFVEKTADTAILRLFTEKEYIEECWKEYEAGNLRCGELTWEDRVFMQEMRMLVEQCNEAYQSMLFREAMKLGFYDLQNARNEYRKSVNANGTPMHAKVMLKFMQVQALVLAPVTPHWSEHIWTVVLKHETSIMSALWPVFDGASDDTILKAAYYIREFVGKVRSSEEKAASKKKKNASPITTNASITTTTNAGRRLKVFVAARIPEWQSTVIDVLKQCYSEDLKKFDGSELERLAAKGLLKEKRVMPFVAIITKSVEKLGASGFEQSFGFNELETLQMSSRFILAELVQVKVKQVEFCEVEAMLENLSASEKIKALMAVPGFTTHVVTDLVEA